MKRSGSTAAAIVCLSTTMLLAGQASTPGESGADEKLVVATVGGVGVFAGDVQRRLEKLTGGREVNPAVLPAIRLRLLREIVDRRLTLAYARRTQSGASPAEVDAALEEFESQLVSRGRSLEEFLQEQSLARSDLRRQITWNLTYRKYVARYVTDARLKSYFEAHRRQFDGTELSVSHILLRGESNDEPRHLDERVQRANAVKRQIASGKMTFAEAARKYSAGPSATGGGRLGFIGRDGPMVEAFSRAAFALEVGQVSEPVKTPFGVHLIRCDRIKPGAKQFADVRKQLEEPLIRDLIEKLARAERRYTPVRFTAATPYSVAAQHPPDP